MPLTLIAVTGMYNGQSQTEARKHILIVWKTLSIEYPAVSLMARSILAIPGAQVSCERLFVLARFTMNSRQRSITDATFEAKIIVQTYLKTSDANWLENLVARELEDENTLQTRDDISNEVNARRAEEEYDGEQAYISADEQDRDSDSPEDDEYTRSRSASRCSSPVLTPTASPQASQAEVALERLSSPPRLATDTEQQRVSNKRQREQDQATQERQDSARKLARRNVQVPISYKE